MYPDKDEALALLAEAESLNPGAWAEHSRMVGECARRIAERCGMNADKAYVCGILHDIGRRYGKRHMGHVVDGRNYMLRLGYDEAARICLTHSFSTKSVDDYIGNIDVTEAELNAVKEALLAIELDDYDRLIQLCDSLVGVRVMCMEERMDDVARRYGGYPERKREFNLGLKKYFEGKMGENIYRVVCDDKELWGK